MKRFDSKGMLLIPNPIPKEKISKQKKVLLLKKCFCHNGHSLINKRAMFNGESGIVFKVKKGRKTGHVALSPVYGYKSRVALDVEMKKGDIWEIRCPKCDEKLPALHECECGGELIALFSDKNANFQDCIVICNKIDCFNAELRHGNEMITLSMIDKL